MFECHCGTFALKSEKRRRTLCTSVFLRLNLWGFLSCEVIEMFIKCVFDMQVCFIVHVLVFSSFPLVNLWFYLCPETLLNKCKLLRQQSLILYL